MSRGDGKTERMLDHARAAALQGKRVIVVAHTHAYAKQLKDRVTHNGILPWPEIEFTGPRDLTGYHCDVFYDHHYFETWR